MLRQSFRKVVNTTFNAPHPTIVAFPDEVVELSLIVASVTALTVLPFNCNGFASYKTLIYEKE